MRVPTMLPTMRYSPHREVVLIWPHDGEQPYLVTRTAVERRVNSRRSLTPDELIDACEDHEGYFTIVAIGRPVVMALDVKAID